MHAAVCVAILPSRISLRSAVRSPLTAVRSCLLGQSSFPRQRPGGTRRVCPFLFVFFFPPFVTPISPAISSSSFGRAARRLGRRFFFLLNELAGRYVGQRTFLHERAARCCAGPPARSTIFASSCSRCPPPRRQVSAGFPSHGSLLRS